MRVKPPYGIIDLGGCPIVERYGTTYPMVWRNVLRMHQVGDLPRDKCFLILLMFNFVVYMFYLNVECCVWINDLHSWFLICY
jgi:hypothetical protein